MTDTAKILFIFGAGYLTGILSVWGWYKWK